MKIALAITAIAALSCSRSKSSDPTPNSSDASSRFVNYSMRMSEIRFGLIGASAFSMTVEGCASGYTSTVTQASTSIAVYKFDQGCLAKLTSVTVDGVQYSPSTDDPFESWSSGDTARFDDVAGSGKSLKFQVLGQLDNPIPETAPTHGVEYAYSTIVQGEDQDCTGDCIANHSGVSVSGADAPGFNVNEFTYVDMSADGSGMFRFKLSCEDAVVGTGTAATCKSNLMSGFRYKLVADTFGGTVTSAQAAAIMETNASSIDASEVVAAGEDAGMTNGGFYSKVLQGPAQIHNNPHMIFILETNATSYKYWNVDVTPIVQQ